MILTADLHLTDAAEDAYRWDIFKTIAQWSMEHGDDRLCIAGDITDRKDRHSGKLVNRLVKELTQLLECMGPDSRIDIIMGNHDKPVQGEPFWTFIDHIEGLTFYTEPTFLVDKGSILLLPFAENPAAAWAGIDLTSADVIIMHQTVTGVVENGHTLENLHMPVFPPGIPVYSGDIHTHQKVGVVQYIAAPHPVKFGDTYECRFLHLSDDDYSSFSAVPTHPPKRMMLDVAGLDALERTATMPGDQARVRFSVPLSMMSQWPADRIAIAEWGKKRGVHLASVEAVVLTGTPRVSGHKDVPELYSDPTAILSAFGKAQDIDGVLLDVGHSLLIETISSNASK